MLLVSLRELVDDVREDEQTFIDVPRFSDHLVIVPLRVKLLLLLGVLLTYLQIALTQSFRSSEVYEVEARVPPLGSLLIIVPLGFYVLFLKYFFFYLVIFISLLPLSMLV